ncbi:pisatin demethylase [Dactylonectria estremocensis]|uniref:Pisatin demethylase n=1 Tax=Dactylonectria estremocensis TaxID=1079267 RepID=A0A9P9DP10_9HYPO|nr:pisatin demethylase [Dactylonectria estremocensis]
MYALLLLEVLALWYVVTAIVAWARLRNVVVPTWTAHFSYLWLAKTTYSGKQYWVHRELHKRFGHLVRIGPNEILTDDPDIIREINAVRGSYARGEWYLTGRFNPYHDNIFTLLDPAIHQKAKLRTGSIYSGRDSGSELEPAIDHQVKELVDLLRRKYVATADTQRFLNLGLITGFFTMDAITRLAFGHEFGYLKEDSDRHHFLSGLKELWPQMSTSADVPWIRRFLFSKPMLKLVGPKPTDMKGFGALMGVAKHYVSERFSEGAKQEQDMLGSFIRRGMTQEECEVEGLFMIIAGIESTASAIRAVLLHIITSPRVYARLKLEIRNAVSEGKLSNPITLEEARRLPYLQAVIYEGLRMRPPLLGLFPKVVPAGGTNFHGQYIPAGTNICMNTSSLLRSEDMFGPDVDLFRPERFMELDDLHRAEMHRNVELAFGYGQWQCLGKPIAFMELNKCVFELLRNFELQLISPGKPCEVHSYGVFVETNLYVQVSESTAS